MTVHSCLKSVKLQSWFSFNNPILFCDFSRLMVHIITEGNENCLNTVCTPKDSKVAMRFARIKGG